MSVSESTNPGQSRRLDEVRAKIFYLASDIESANEPAAMLLRAVAESIVEGGEAFEPSEGRATLNGLPARLVYSTANEVRPTAPSMPDAVLAPAQHAGPARSASGHKR